MKLLYIFLIVYSFTACNNSHNASEADSTTARKRTETPVDTIKHEVLFFEASGFEPMWSLKINIGPDGTYPATFTSVTEEMNGILKKVSDHVFTGTVKGRTTERTLKLTITHQPCMHEDGITEDPQTAIIKLDNMTYTGCGKKS